MQLTDTDWNQREEFFRFTRGRFVYDESEQLARRYVRFNMNALASLAADAAGATECVDIQKCPDGMYNKAFILTMDNGKQVIGKIPNPNAGIPHYTTASEVATMDFVSWQGLYALSFHSRENNRFLDAEFPTDPRATRVPMGF